MKNQYTSFIAMLIAILFLQNCAPKYTANFQKPSNRILNNYPSNESTATEIERTPVLASLEEKPITIPNETVQPLVISKIKPEEKAASNETEKQILQEVRRSLKSMSPEEKKALKSTFKEAIKQMKDKNTTQDDAAFILLIILAVILPPVGMLVYEGELSARFWLSLLLTILGYLPGIIYTLYVILGGK